MLQMKKRISETDKPPVLDLGLGLESENGFFLENDIYD